MTPILTIILLVLCFEIAIAGAASAPGNKLGYVAMGTAALAVVLIALAAIGSLP